MNALTPNDICALKLVFSPEVYLVAATKIDDEELQVLARDLGAPNWRPGSDSDPEKVVEVAGRLCYMSFTSPRPGGAEAYIGHILQSRHGSVLEHATFTLVFTGVSRSLTHELVRHRAGMSYSQLSQRYVGDGELRFVVPWELRTEVRAAIHQVNTFADLPGPRNAPAADRAFEEACRDDPALGMEPDEAWHAAASGRTWLNVVNDARHAYITLAGRLTAKVAKDYPDIPATDRRKVTRQTARSILPNAAETRIAVTGNARAWRHFLELRGSRHADAEIRRLAGFVLDRLQEKSPLLFGDFIRTTLPDYTPELVSGHPKV